MAKQWILVVDSGTGGLHTISELKQIMPNENYLFYMDKSNCPYGNKNTKKLKKILEDIIIKAYQKFDIKLVVVACNTLGSVADLHIKQTFPHIPFVFVEPYLNSQILSKPTLVLATKNTIKHNRKLRLLKGKKNLYLHGFGNLAKKIDICNNNFDILQGHLNRQLKKFRRKNIENVVLGCTHFNHIKTQIEKALGTKVEFFEGSPNVAQNAKLTLCAIGKQNKSQTLGEILILCKL